MATDHGHGNGNGRNPGVEYDKSDLSPKGILIFFVVLAVFALVIHITVLGLYAGMTKIADKREAQITPLAPQTYTPRTEILTNTANVNVQQFPEPRLEPHLQGTPGKMTKFLLQESAVLTAKPWQDAQGNVHLPIDEAMKLVLKRLPVRTGGMEIPNYPGASRRYSYPEPPIANAGAIAGMDDAAEPGQLPSGAEGGSASKQAE
jgi:hypothetical protein